MFSKRQDTIHPINGSPKVRSHLLKYVLQWLENYALGHAIFEVSCRVRIALSQNFGLYVSNGFSIIKEEVLINPNGRPVKTVVMTKPLGD